MRLVLTLALLLATLTSAASADFYTTSDEITISGCCYDSLGYPATPDSVKIWAYRDGALLDSGWYNTGDAECAASDVPNHIVFSAAISAIDGAGGDGQYELIAGFYEHDDIQLYSYRYMTFYIGVDMGSIATIAENVDGDGTGGIDEDIATILTYTDGDGSDGIDADIAANGTAISGLNNIAAADVWSVGTRTLTTADWTTDSDLDSLYAAASSASFAAKVWGADTSTSYSGADFGYQLIHGFATVDDLADGVWDELQSGHTDDGSFGALLDDSVSQIGGTGATAQEVWEYSGGARTLTAFVEGDMTIDLDGTAVGSVAGAVGSVTGNVGGNVAGSVGSVVGNVGGNVTGSVGSISGVTFPTNFEDMSITATTGLVGINLDDVAGTLSDAEIEDITVGSVTGAVGSVTGSVGSVTGAVGSVTGNVGGDVTGSVGSISGITFPTNFADLSITATTGYVALATTDWTTDADLTPLATSAALATVDANVDLIVTYTDGDGSAGIDADIAANGTAIGGLNDIAAADVWNVAFNTAFSAGSMGDSLNNSTYVQGTASGLTAAEIWDYDLTGWHDSVDNQAGYFMVCSDTGLYATQDDVVDGVWDEVQSGHTTDGTFGAYLDDSVSQAGGGSCPSASDIYAEFTSGSNADAFKATGFSTHSAADVWSVGTKEITSLSAAALEDIWFYDLTGMGDSTSNEAGYFLFVAGDSSSWASAGDVWDVSQADHTTDGTFGAHLDDTVSEITGGAGADSAAVYAAVQDLADDYSLTRADSTQEWVLRRLAVRGDNAYIASFYIDNTSGSAAAVDWTSDWAGYAFGVSNNHASGTATTFDASGSGEDFVADITGSVDTVLNGADSAVVYSAIEDALADGLDWVVDNFTIDSMHASTVQVIGDYNNHASLFVANYGTREAVKFSGNGGPSSYGLLVDSDSGHAVRFQAKGNVATPTTETTASGLFLEALGYGGYGLLAQNSCEDTAFTGYYQRGAGAFFAGNGQADALKLSCGAPSDTALGYTWVQNYAIQAEGPASFYSRLIKTGGETAFQIHGKGTGTALNIYSDSADQAVRFSGGSEGHGLVINSGTDGGRAVWIQSNDTGVVVTGSLADMVGDVIGNRTGSVDTVLNLDASGGSDTTAIKTLATNNPNLFYGPTASGSGANNWSVYVYDTANSEMVSGAYVSVRTLAGALEGRQKTGTSGVTQPNFTVDLDTFVVSITQPGRWLEDGDPDTIVVASDGQVDTVSVYFDDVTVSAPASENLCTVYGRLSDAQQQNAPYRTLVFTVAEDVYNSCDSATLITNQVKATADGDGVYSVELLNTDCMSKFGQSTPSGGIKWTVTIEGSTKKGYSFSIPSDSTTLRIQW